MNFVRIFFVGGLISYRALFNWIRPSMYIPTMLGSPLFQLIFFTKLGQFAHAESPDFYIVGNSVQVAAMASIYGMAMSIANERSFGTLGPLLATPANRAAVFLGRGLPVLANGFFVSLFTFLAGAVFLGFRPGLSTVPALAAVVVVTTTACTSFGMMLGSIGLRAKDYMFAANLTYFLMLLFCGVNIPLSVLPGWMSAISRCLPLTHGIAAAREVANGATLSDVAGLVWTELAIAVVVRRGRLRALPRARARVTPERPPRRLLADQLLAQGLGDGLGARVRVELVHRLAHVRAHRLGGDEEPLPDLLVRETVREQPQDVALALRQLRQLRADRRRRQRAGEHRVDIRAAAGDRLHGAEQVVHRRLLEHEPAHTRVERLGQERAVAVPRVEQDRGLGRRPLRAPRQLDPAELRHPDVDERDRGLASLDLLQRLFAVTRPRDDLDPAQGEELGHGLEHGRMVVGHDAGDGLGCGRGQRFGSRGIPDSGDGPGTARGISKQTPAANSCRVTFTGTSNTVRQTITPGTAPDGRLDQALVEAQLEQVLDRVHDGVVLTSNGRATLNAAARRILAAPEGLDVRSSIFEPRALDGTPFAVRPEPDPGRRGTRGTTPAGRSASVSRPSTAASSCSTEASRRSSTAR